MEENVSNLLQVESWYYMFKVISPIMAHWYEMWNTFVWNKLQRLEENKLCIDVYQRNYYGRKCLSNFL